MADGHELVLRGLRDFFSEEDDFEVVGEASTAADALERIARSRAEVALVDVKLPDGDGVEVCRKITTKHPRIEVVMLTSFDDGQTVLDSIRAGASGYLLKDAKLQEIASALRKIAGGQPMFHPSLMAGLLERARSQGDDRTAGLNTRERQVLSLLGEGLPDKEIAQRLGVAPKTVRNNVSNLLGKLGMRNRTEAAIFASKLIRLHKPPQRV